MTKWEEMQDHSGRIVLTLKKHREKHILQDSPCVIENFLDSYDIYSKSTT